MSNIEAHRVNRLHSRPRTSSSTRCREQLVQNLARQNDLLRKIKAIHNEVLPEQVIQQQSRVIVRASHAVSNGFSRTHVVRIKQNKDRVYHNFFHNSFGKKTIWENLAKYTHLLQAKLQASHYVRGNRKGPVEIIIRASSAR